MRARTRVAIVAVVTLAGLLGVRTAVATPFAVPTPSMSPTIAVGDVVLANLVAYGLQLPGLGEVIPWGAPVRGEVVLVEHPDTPGRTMFKRVVAVGGDRVEVRDNRVWIDDRPVEVERIGPTRVAGASCREQPRTAWREGDHTIVTAARAGRYANHGPVTVPPGHVFVLGDNRDDSEDSRAFGSLPRARIRGRYAGTVFRPGCGS